LTFTADTLFSYGEEVLVTLTRGIKTLHGDSLGAPYQFKFTAVAIGGTGIFTQASAPAVGNSPAMVSIGDFDRNGYPDIAAVNRFGNSVSILKNIGNGAFGTAATVNLTANAAAIVKGDFDGDGNIDLAVSVTGGNTIAILKNSGTGTFTNTSNITVGTNPGHIVAEDIDGDGDIDIVLADYNTATATTLRPLINNGSGTFVQGSLINLTSVASQITFADVDGDGLLDILVTRSSLNDFVVCRNLGGALFSVGASNACSTAASGIIAGDINGDGTADVIVINYVAGNAFVFTNNGNGVFTKTATLTLSTNPNSGMLFDIDGDGDLDLVVPNQQNSTVFIFKNNGSGVFSQTGTITGLNTPQNVVAADLDCDGDMDFVLPNFNGANISIQKNGNAQPAVPQNLNAIAGDAQITLKWSKNTDADFLKYKIYIGADSTTMSLKDSSTASISDTTKTIIGLTNGTKYFFRVSALDSARLESGQSYAVSMTPSATVAHKMVQVAGGTITIGSENILDNGASPSHLVTLSSFSISNTEISWGLWDSVYQWGISNGYTDISAGQKGYTNGDASHPVANINWYDVVKWCNARSQKEGLTPVYYTTTVFIAANIYKTGNSNLLNTNVNWSANGYRLPTEAEWEFAARSGMKSSGYIYSGSNTIDSVSWFATNSSNNTHSVGGKAPNELGLYDMSGNVWEWVWDWFGAYSNSEQTNPYGVTTGTYRVLRGGSFYLLDGYSRVAFRANDLFPSDRKMDFGFRCAKIKTVSTPQNLLATAVSQKINLKWNKVADTDIRTYRIYGGITANPTTKIDSVATPNDTTKTIINLTNGQIYYYRVTAVDISGLESAYSNEVQIAPTIIANGLVAYYPLNSNSNDGSGNRKNSTSNNAVSRINRFGDQNQAYSFNGTNQGIAVNNFTFAQTQITVSIWFICNQVGSSGNRMLEQDVTNGGSISTAMIAGNIPQTSFLVNGNSFVQVTSSQPANLAEWTHFVATYDGNVAKLYINNILTGSVNDSRGFLSKTATLLIASGSQWALNGSLDDIRIYNRALSVIEIDSLYREGGYNSPPATPQNLLTTSGNGLVNLQWNKITDTDLRSYKIYYGTSSPASTLIDSTTQRLDTSKTINGLTNGTPYYFRVLAMDSAGQVSGYSNEVIATPYQLLAGEYSADSNTVLLLHFSENTGQFAQDASSKNNHGTATGTSIVNGKFGKGRQFTSTPDADVVNIGNPFSGIQSKFTIEMWLNISQLNVSSHLFTHYKGTADAVVMGWGNGASHNPAAVIGVGGTSNVSLGVSTPTIGKYYHVAMTYDNQKIRLYWNGKEEGSFIYAGTNYDWSSNYISTQIGNLVSTSGNYEYSGIIDEVRISKITRLPQEFNLQLAPSNLAANASGSTVTLTWQNGGGAAPLMKYYIYRGLDSTSQSLIDSTAQTTYTNIGLASGIKVFYRISAVDSTVFEGVKSFAVSATPYVPPVPPLVVSLYQPDDAANNLKTSQLLTWSRPVSTEQFKIEVGTESSFTTGIIYRDSTRVDTFYNLTSLPNNGTIYWRVFAINSAGISPVSETHSFSTRVASPVPVLTVLDTQKIKIKWNAIPGALGYNVLVSTNSTTYSIKPFISAGTDSLVDAGLVPGSRYYYKVLALSSLGLPSDTSSIVSGYTKPSVPVNLQIVERTDDKIKLTWAKGNGSIANYRLYRSFNNGTFGLLTPTTGNSYTDSGLVAGATYKYRVRSVNGATVESDTLSQISVTTFRQLPRIAALNTIKAAVSGNVKLPYSAIVYGSDSVYFRLLYSLDGGNTYTLSHNTSGKDSLLIASANDTIIWESKFDLIETFNSSVKLKLVPYGVEGGVDSEPYSMTSSPFTIDNKMPVFAGIQSVMSDSTKLNISWNAGSDNSSPLKYNLYKSATSTIDYSQIAATVSGTSSVLSGLNNYQPYYIAVRAVDTLGNIDTNTIVKSGIPAALSRITSITTLSGTKNGSFSIPFVYSIAANDTVKIIALYSVDGGVSFDTIRNVSQAISQKFISGNDTIKWSSALDYNQENNSAVVKIVPVGHGGAGYSVMSNVFALDNKAPQFAGLQTAVGDTNKVLLNWSAATDISAPVKFKVFKSTASGIFNYSVFDTIVTGTSVTIRNLENFRKYYFVIRAIDNVGNSDTNTTEVSAIPSVLPSIVSVTKPPVVKSGSVTIPYSITVPLQDSVRLICLYSVNGGTSYDTARTVTGRLSNIVSSSVDSLFWQSNIDYSSETMTAQFKIVPLGKGGSGAFKTTANFGLDNKPPLFAGLQTVFADTNRVTLSWSAGTDQSTPLKYSVYKSLTNRAENFITPDTTVTSTSITLKNLENFRRYYFVVRSEDALGNRDTNTVELNAIPTVKPSIAGLSSPTGIQHGIVKIPFTMKVGLQDTSNVNVFYSFDGGTQFTKTVNVTGKISAIVQNSADTITWNSSADYLNETTTLKIKVVASGKGGSGDSSVTSSFTLDNKAPLFAGLQTAVGDTNKVLLNWSAATDISAPVKYSIYRSETGIFDYVKADTTIATLGTTFSNLENFKQYYFVVRAVDNVGNIDTNTRQYNAAPTMLSSITALVTPKGTNKKEIKIPYVLSVGKQDTVMLSVLYSTNGGITYDTTKNITGKINYIPQTTSDTISWKSSSDFIDEGKTIYVKIVPRGKGGVGIDRSTNQFTVDNKAPAFGGIISAIGDTNKVILSWNPAVDISTPVTYKIYGSKLGDSINYASPIATTNATGAVVANLENFVPYHFVVRATDSVLNAETNSVERIATPTVRPLMASVTSPATVRNKSINIPYSVKIGLQDTVNLILLYSANNGVKYDTARSVSGPIAKLSGNRIDSLTWNTAIDYPNESHSMKIKIVPIGKGGIGTEKESNKFAVDNKIPAFGGVTTANPDTNRILLSWSAATDSTTPISYKIFKTKNGTPFDFAVPETTVSSLSWTIRNLENFVLYNFIVRAIDGIGNGDSNSVQRSARPTAKPTLTNLSAPSRNNGTITFTYNVSGVIEDTIQVSPQYSVDGGSSWNPTTNVTGDLKDIIPSSSIKNIFWNTTTDSMLLSTVVQKMKSQKNMGDEARNISSMFTSALESNIIRFRLSPTGKGGSGNFVGTQNFVVDNKAPRFAGLKEILPDSIGTSVRLNWNNAADLSQPITYLIYRSYVAGSIGSLIDSVKGDTTKVLQSLTTFTKYYFTVRAKDNLSNIELDTVQIGILPTRAVKVTSIVVPSTISRDYVPVQFSLDASILDTARIELWYLLNGGSTWQQSQQITGVTNVITSFGTQNLIKWITLKEVPNIESFNAQIKIMAYGRGGKGLEKSSLPLVIDTKMPSFTGLVNNVLFDPQEVGAAIVSWNAAADTSKPILYYIYSDTSKISYATAIDSTDKLTWTSHNLLNKQNYLFAVRARDGVGNIDSNITQKQFRVPLLADYNDDNKVDGKDVTAFVNAWPNNIKLGDIGPVSGIVPNLIALHDKKVDFEDLMALGLMWEWSAGNTHSIPFAKLNTGQQRETPEANFVLNGSAVLLPEQTAIFRPTLAQSVATRSIEMMMTYDPDKLTVDSIGVSNVQGLISFKYSNVEKGTAGIVITSFNDTLSSLIKLQNIVSLKVSAKSKLMQEPLKLALFTYDSSGNVSSSLMKEIVFNWRPIVPEVFALSQNYPNPFNPITTIEYQIPKDTRVTVKIYNILGQEVATLVDGDLKAGYYNMKWDARNMSSGVYIYRMFTKDYVQSKKMLILK
jgi:formylglycine-generating enzyme required for sulfatase activity